MNFKLTDKQYKGHQIYSNGEIEAVKNGAIFKGTNASVVERDIYVSNGIYFIVPIGAKLVGGNFVGKFNIER